VVVRQATIANEIALVEDVSALSVLDAIAVEARGARIELEMPNVGRMTTTELPNAGLLKVIEVGSPSVGLQKMIVLREASIGTAEVVKENLSVKDIKAENRVGSRVGT